MFILSLNLDMWLEFAPVYKNLMFFNIIFFTSQLQTAITQKL